MVCKRHLCFALAVSVVLGAAIGGCSGCEDSTGTDTDTTSSVDGTPIDTIDPFNFAPTVELTGPTEGQVFQLGESISVVGKVGDAGDSPADLKLSLVSDVDGPLGEPEANDAGFVTFEIASLSPGVHHLTMTAEDSGGLTGRATVEIEINVGPTVAEVTIHPAEPTTLDALEAELTVPFTDPNRAADQLTITWTWFRNGEDSGLPGETIPADRTVKGEVWRVLVTAEDPYGKRAQAEKSVTIGNAPPTCGAAILLPASGGTDDEFTCDCSDRFEPDPGDPEVDTCEFFSGDTSLESDNCTLLATSTSKGMAISCRLTPGDGEDTSRAVDTVTALVFNTSPTQPEVAITPTTGRTQDSYTCTVTNTPVDADGDSFQLEYTWIVNNYSNPTGTVTTVVPRDDLVKDSFGSPVSGGDTLRCRVRAYDGTDRSPPGTSQTVLMQNTPPSGGTVTLRPDAATEDDTLTCTALGATDADGDTIAWRIEWLVNGEVVDDVTTGTLEPTHFVPGDEVTCRATPVDSVSEGPTIEADHTLTITNTPPSKPAVELSAPLGADGPVTCMVTEASTDSQALTQTFYWSLNGGAEFSGEASLPEDQVAPCNMITCRLVVSDGTTEITSELATATMPVGSCDDSDPCTTNACQPDGSCLTTFNTGTCNDLDPCTESDTCHEGVCAGVARTCDDDQFCTTDSCDPLTGNCVNVLNDSLCHDENACTDDRCSFQANGGLGGCVFDPADDIPCEADHDGCTIGDHCLNKECVPGERFNCEEGQEPAQCFLRQCASTGDTSFTCDIVSFDIKVVCDDGLFCTVGDHCDGSGVCAGGGDRDCGEALGVCQTASCNEANDRCDIENIPDETPCDADSSGCTIDDACEGGACVAGAAPDCTGEADECNGSACVSTSSESYECVPVPKPVDTPCTSTDYCIINKTCDDEGVCSGGEPRDCDESIGTQCTTAYCDSNLALCIPQLVNNGTPCDDGDPCTQPDSCSFGTCTSSTSICVEEPLSVEGLAARPPNVTHLGSGRYIAQWYRTGAGRNYMRFSNVGNSRENREDTVGSGAFTHSIGPDHRLLGAASHGGKTLLLTATGTYSCPKFAWCGSALDRTIDIQTRGAVYDSQDALVVSRNLLGVTATKPAYGDPMAIGAYSVPLAFGDGTWGLVHSTIAPESCTQYGCYVISVQQSIRYRPLAEDLTPGTLVTLVPTVNHKNLRVFDAAPNPAGDEFVLAWVPPAGGEILVRRFDMAGAPLADAASVTLAAGASALFIDVAVAADGHAVVAWTERVQDSPDTVKAVSFAAVAPTAVPTALQAEPLATAESLLGGVAILTDGGVVITWAGEGVDDDGTAVLVQVFDAAGQALAPPRLAHQATLGDQRLPNVAALDLGRFVVAYVDPDGEVWTRTFASTGAPEPGAVELEVSQTPQLDQRDPVGASDEGASVMVAWVQTSLGDTISDIFARQFDPTGHAMMEQVRVNSTIAGAQTEPAVAGGGGRYAVVWTSEGQDGDGKGAYLRVLPSDGAAPSPELVLDDTPAGDQEEPQVALGGGEAVAVWRVGGAVRGRGFGVSGGVSARSSAWTLDPQAAGDAAGPRVTATSAGFVVTWQRSDGLGGSVSTLQRVDALGNTLAGPKSYPNSEGDTVSESSFVVSAGVGLLCRAVAAPARIECLSLDPDTLDSPGAPFVVSSEVEAQALVVSSLKDGTALVAWDALGVDGSGRAIQHARVGAAGLLTPRVQGNRSRVADQSTPFIASVAGAAHPYILGWESDGQDGSGLGVYLRALDLSSYPDPP